MLDFLLLLGDEASEILFNVALGHLDQFLAGGFFGQPSDFFQLFLLLAANLTHLGLEVVEFFLLLG